MADRYNALKNETEYRNTIRALAGFIEADLDISDRIEQGVDGWVNEVTLRGVRSQIADLAHQATVYLDRPDEAEKP